MNKSQFELMKNFINEYEKNNELLNYNLERDFENLRHYSMEVRMRKSAAEGEREYNKRKNRYKDILPFDDSRVILKSLQNGENKEIGSDYINASKVDGALEDSYKYIAAQGPTRDTVPDFVRMLRDYKIKILICACNEFEGQKLKCHRYWTDNDQEAFCIYPNFYVELKSKPIIYEGCIVRTLVVTYPKSAFDPSLNSDEYARLEFVQYHFTNWPDHGVPESCESIINILRLVRQDMIGNNRRESEARGKKVPLSNEYLVVHCSAGCGRTGTIIAIDQLWTLMDENKLTSDFSMFRIAAKLREQRVAMIQTSIQYQLFAKATYYLFVSKMLETSASSAPVNQSVAYNAKMKTHSSNPSKSVAPLAPSSTAILGHHSQSQILDRLVTPKKDVSPSATSHYDNDTRTSDKIAYAINSFQQHSSSIDTNNNNVYPADVDPDALCVSDLNSNQNDSSSSASSSSSTTSSPKSSSTTKDTKKSKHKSNKLKKFFDKFTPSSHSHGLSSNTTSASSISVSSKDIKPKLTLSTEPATTNDTTSKSDEPDDDDVDVIVDKDTSKSKQRSSLTPKQTADLQYVKQPSSADFPSVNTTSKNSSAEESGQEKTPKNQVVRRRSRPQPSDFVNRIEAGENATTKTPAQSAKADFDTHASSKTGSLCEFVNKSSKSEAYIPRNLTTPLTSSMTQSQTSNLSNSSNFPTAKIYTISNPPKSVNSIQSDVKPGSRFQRVDQLDGVVKFDKPKLKEQSSTDRPKAVSGKEDASDSDPPKPPSRPKNDRRKSSYTVNNSSNPSITPTISRTISKAGKNSDSDSINSEDDEGQSKSSYLDSANELSASKKLTNADRTSPSIFSNLDKQPNKSIALIDNNPHLHRSILSVDKGKVPNSVLYGKARSNPAPGGEIKINDENTPVNKIRSHAEMDMVMSMSSDTGPRRMSMENQDQLMSQSQTNNSSSGSSSATKIKTQILDSSLSRTLPSRKHMLNNPDQFSLEQFKNEQMKLYNNNINNINLKNNAQLLSSNSGHSNYRYSQNALNNYYRIHHNYNYKYLPQFRQQLHHQVRYDNGNMEKDASSIYSNHSSLMNSCGPNGTNGGNMTTSNFSNANTPLNFPNNNNSEAIYNHNNTNHKRRSTQLFNL